MLNSDNMYIDEVDSVENFLSVVFKFYNTKKDQLEKKHIHHLFFRGQERACWNLLPSVFRKDYNERDLVLDIKQYAQELKFDYDFIKEMPLVLTDMQHFEIPTRLLDWTVEPLTALFFAVNNFDCKEAKVWVFNPWEYSFLNYDIPQILDINVLFRALLAYGWHEKEIKNILEKQYGFDCACIKDIEKPIAFVGSFTNKRKIVQRGCFVIYGSNKEPFENYCKSKNCLNYILIRNKEKIKEQLNELYINDLTVYPDFIGAKKQIEKYKGLFYLKNESE